MQHFILNGKILELEKNKKTALAIPVLFNAGCSEFILEVPEDKFKEGIAIELSVYRSKGDAHIRKISLAMTSNAIRFTPLEVGNLDAEDYLLYSCRANYSTRLALSIVAM